MDAVLLPSATIAPGYGTIIVETKTGVAFQGVLKQTSEAGVQLMGADGELVSIPTAEIKEQSGSSLSLMPEGMQAAVSFQEFTDLIEYLATLQQPESTLVSHHGMPSIIPQLAKPANLRPYLRIRSYFHVPEWRLALPHFAKSLDSATNFWFCIKKE